MNYSAIVKMMWFGDIVNGISTFLAAVLTLGILALVVYGVFTYLIYEECCIQNEKDEIIHRSKRRIILSIVILMFLSIIAIVTPTKDTVYVAAGANLAEQIEKNTNIPKRVDDLLDAIEVNLKNNTNTKTN
jgi:formate hydrogenlyase subunit 3/multisubunit Na+/H+ antiporter MnhD subunit